MNASKRPAPSPRVTGPSQDSAAAASNRAVQSIRTDDDPALFDAVVERLAFGRPTTTLVPSEYVRGPGPRPTPRGPQDAQAPPWWLEGAERIVLALVDSGHRVTSDDLHDRFPDEPSASGAAFGGLFARLARQGRIIEVGMVRSRRPEARRRRIILSGAP